MKKFTTYHDFVGELTITYTRTKKLTAKIKYSKSAADFIRPYYDRWMDDQEVAMVIHVNNANMVVNVHKVSSGSDTGTIIEVKRVVRHALQLPVTACILVHNHPSGTLEVSKPDIAISKKLRVALEYMDIKLLDSLIMTRESYVSLADEGLI